MDTVLQDTEFARNCRSIKEANAQYRISSSWPRLFPCVWWRDTALEVPQILDERYLRSWSNMEVPSLELTKLSRPLADSAKFASDAWKPDPTQRVQALQDWKGSMTREWKSAQSKSTGKRICERSPSEQTAGPRAKGNKPTRR